MNYSLKAAARILQIGPNKLRDLLVEKNIFSAGNPRLPKTEFIKAGYFGTTNTTYKKGLVEHWTVKATVTSNGIAFLRQLIDETHMEKSQPVSPGKPSAPARQTLHH